MTNTVMLANILNQRGAEMTATLLEDRLIEYWRLHELLREAIDKHPHNWDDGDYKAIKDKLDDMEKRFGI